MRSFGAFVSFKRRLSHVVYESITVDVFSDEGASDRVWCVSSIHLPDTAGSTDGSDDEDVP